MTHDDSTAEVSDETYQVLSRVRLLNPANRCGRCGSVSRFGISMSRREDRANAERPEQLDCGLYTVRPISKPNVHNRQIRLLGTSHRDGLGGSYGYPDNLVACVKKPVL